MRIYYIFGFRTIFVVTPRAITNQLKNGPVLFFAEFRIFGRCLQYYISSIVIQIAQMLKRRELVMGSLALPAIECKLFCFDSNTP